MKRRVSLLATTAVVPAPMNGSKTTPGVKPFLHLQPSTATIVAYSLPIVASADFVGEKTFRVSCGVPQRLHTLSGHPARIGRSISFSGNIAKCPELEGVVAISQTSIGFFPAGESHLRSFSRIVRAASPATWPFQPLPCGTFNAPWTPMISPRRRISGGTDQKSPGFLPNGCAECGSPGLGQRRTPRG